MHSKVAVQSYYDRTMITLCARYDCTTVCSVDKVRYEMLTFYSVYCMYVCTVCR